MASLCHIPKEKISSKNSKKVEAWKLDSGPFVFAKNLAKPLLENEIFEAIFLCYKCNSKATKISPNQYVGLHGFLFTENSLKIKKGLELASRLYFLYNFLIKNFIFTFISKFHYQTVFTYQVIQQNVFRVSCISI